MASCNYLALAFFVAFSCSCSSINLVLAARHQWLSIFGSNLITPLPKPKLPPISLTPPPHFAAAAPPLPHAVAMAPAPALQMKPRGATTLSPAVMAPVLPPTSRLHGGRMAAPLGSPRSLSLPQSFRPSSAPAAPSQT